MSDKMKNEIERLEAARRYVADNLVDAIWVLDADTYRYEYVTPSIERISGYTEDELREMPLSQWMTAESEERVVRTIKAEQAQFEKSGRAVVKELEVECIHKSGRTYWTDIRAKLRRDADGNVKILGVTRDITERKKLELKQESLISQLGEALAEKERLAKENNVLRDLLPICSGCRRIRDENNRWWPLDSYVAKKARTKFTHTICPDCKAVMYDDS